MTEDLSKRIEENARNFLTGRGEFTYLSQRRKECEILGHKKSIISQSNILMDIYTEEFLRHGTLKISEFCDYCKTFYSREPTNEEIKQYLSRQEEFQRKLHEPFTI